MPKKSKTLDMKALAVAAGTTWGLFLLFLGWAGAAGWGAALVNALGTLYIGYAPTALGGIIGGIWGFVDGAIGGAIFAYVYNRFVG